MKKLLTIASAIALGSIATQAFASDGTINFTGTISNVTCTLAAAGGGTTGTVTLPTVTQSALKAAGDTAGATQFSIKLSGCTGTPAPTQAAAWFETGPEVNAAGRLVTTIADTATDTLSIAIYNTTSQPHRHRPRRWQHRQQRFQVPDNQRQCNAQLSSQILC
jgi:major type 1 subunit fimbrin (pilin)